MNFIVANTIKKELNNKHSMYTGVKIIKDNDGGYYLYHPVWGRLNIKKVKT